MNVSLPDEMKSWVEAQTEGGRYSNSSDYVRDLIRKDREYREAVAALQLLVDEAMASGISERTMEDIRRDARARHGISDA